MSKIAKKRNADISEDRMDKPKRKRRRKGKPIRPEQQGKTINWLIADTPLEARWFDSGDRTDARQMAQNAEKCRVR